MSIARRQYLNRQNIQIAAHSHHTNCIICNVRIPIIAPAQYPNKHHYHRIRRSEIQQLFLKYGLMVKQRRYYCNNPPLATHNVTSIDDLYNKIPKGAMNGHSLLRSYHQALNMMISDYE